MDWAWLGFMISVPVLLIAGLFMEWIIDRRTDERMRKLYGEICDIANHLEALRTWFEEQDEE